MSEYIGMYKHHKDLIHKYGKKLNIDKDMITDVYFPVIKQIDQILKDKIEPHVQMWDEIGAKLGNDGRVIFPKYVDEAYNILVKDKKGPRLYETFLPEKYDGVGFPGIILSPIMEIIAYYDLSLSNTIGLATTLIEAIGLYPTEYLTQKYYKLLQEGAGGFVAFTEPVAGSNLRNIKSTSELDGDNYIVKGTKILITNAGFADIGIVLARNIVNGKEEGTNALMVESKMVDADDSTKPGIKCTRLEEKLGIHSSATGVLEFNCVVPKENILGKVGEGYRTVLERLLGMRMGVAGQSTALAERAYQLAKSYAKERVQFNKPIISFAAVSNKLKGMEKELLKMRQFVFESAYVLSRYQLGLPIKTKYLKLNKGDESTLKEFSSQYNRAILNHTISKAKMYNSEVGWMIVDDALQIFGGNGFIRDYNVERLLRDFRVLRIYEGTSEIHEVVVNRTGNVATADNMNTLMQVAMADKGALAASPDRIPIDYQEIFFKRFGSTMNSFMDDEGETIYLFDD